MLFAPNALALTNEEVLQRITNLENEIVSLKLLLTGDAPTDTLKAGQNSAQNQAKNEDVVDENVLCHQGNIGEGNFCSTNCKCAIGQGDCDSNSHCQSGYCAFDVGKKYGFYPTIDVCEAKPNVPAQNNNSAKPAGVAPISFNPNDIITITGRAIDLDSQEPISQVKTYLVNTALAQDALLFEGNSKGFFEIKLDVRVSLNKQIKIKSDYHQTVSFYVCDKCLGYNRALIFHPFKGTEIIFPLLADKLNLGDVALKQANDLIVFSERFVKASVEFLNDKGVFVETGATSDFRQKIVFNEALPLGYTARLILEDKQGKQYQAETTPQIQAVLPATLTMALGKFSLGVCGNGICEKEDFTCPSDCLSVCVGNEPKGQNECLLGCQDNQCKKDIVLTYPSPEAGVLEEGKEIVIEWFAVGLNDEEIDLELLAYGQDGGLAKGFKYEIATSVKAAENNVLWKVAGGLPQENQYKFVAYNKMCSESGELLVSCLKERYLSKSQNYFSLKQKETSSPFLQAQLANISQAVSLLLAKIQALLK